MNRNILVTGGAGYIGSKIVSDLISKKYKVFIVDNLSTGHKFLVNKKAKFFKCDISNKQKINNILKKNNIISIIHCAASLIIEESEKKPKKYYVNNVLNTKKLLEVAIKNNLKNFIFSSTAAVYGKVFGKVNELTKTRPISVYGKTKLKAEAIIKNYSKIYNFNYGILRYFNVAGSDMKKKIGPVNFNNQLFKNITRSIYSEENKVFIFGKNLNTRDGSCIRDYIHLNDISLIHCKLLKIMCLNKKSYLINCGYGKGYSVLDVIHCFEKTFNIILNKIFLLKRKNEVITIYSDARYLKKILGIKFNLKNKLKQIVTTSMKWEMYINEK